MKSWVLTARIGMKVVAVEISSKQTLKAAKKELFHVLNFAKKEGAEVEWKLI